MIDYGPQSSGTANNLNAVSYNGLARRWSARCHDGGHLLTIMAGLPRSTVRSAPTHRASPKILPGRS